MHITPAWNNVTVQRKSLFAANQGTENSKVAKSLILILVNDRNNKVYTFILFQGSVLYHYFTDGNIEKTEGSSITEGKDSLI